MGNPLIPLITAADQAYDRLYAAFVSFRTGKPVNGRDGTEWKGKYEQLKHATIQGAASVRSGHLLSGEQERGGTRTIEGLVRGVREGRERRQEEVRLCEKRMREAYEQVLESIRSVQEELQALVTDIGLAELVSSNPASSLTLCSLTCGICHYSLRSTTTSTINASSSILTLRNPCHHSFHQDCLRTLLSTLPTEPLCPSCHLRITLPPRWHDAQTAASSVIVWLGFLKDALGWMERTEERRGSAWWEGVVGSDGTGEVKVADEWVEKLVRFEWEGLLGL